MAGCEDDSVFLRVGPVSFDSAIVVPPESALKLKGVPNAAFKSNVDVQFICGICNMVLRFPVQTTCGDRFCYGCIYRYFEEEEEDSEKKKPCPSCEYPICFSVNKDHYSRCQLNKEILFCAYKAQGCREEMTMGNFEEHSQKCSLRHIPCPNRELGCMLVASKSDIEKHVLEKCSYRSALCDICNEFFLAGDLQTHAQKCVKFAEDCANRCGEKIHRDHLEAHYRQCPLATLECIFKEYGCKYRGTRSEMTAHMVDPESTAKHLQQTYLIQEQQRATLAETKLIVEQLLSFNDTLRDNTIVSLTREANAASVTTKKNETQVRELHKFVAKHADRMDNVESNVRHTAKREELLEIKKNMFKPLQEKQDRMDVRLHRLETNHPGGGDQGGNGGAVSNIRVACIENQLGMHAVRLAEYDLRFQILETANFDGVLLWKIKDFARRKRDANNGKTLSLYSQPFYTSRYGYKMCARIYLNGDGIGKGTHVSMFFVVMRGDYDALQTWPFRQKVTLMLLDQNTGRRHLSDSFRPEPKSSSFQRPTTEMNIASGCPLFVNQTIVQDTAYVKDDVMFLKVIVDTFDLYGP